MILFFTFEYYDLIVVSNLKKMKKNTVAILLIIGLFVLISVVFAVRSTNRLNLMDEAINESWAQVENVYQRRLDLIPNLVNTVKGYAEHEKGVLESVTLARAAATTALSAAVASSASRTAARAAVIAPTRSPRRRSSWRGPRANGAIRGGPSCWPTRRAC